MKNDGPRMQVMMGFDRWKKRMRTGYDGWKMRTVTGYILLFCLLAFAGCGKASYDAEENTVFVLKKGRIVTTDIGEFPLSEYSRDEFESYVKDTIKEYTDQYGEDTVQLESLSVEEDTAKLTLEYASAQDFSRFSGVELFSGTVSEAVEGGYDFNADFVDARTGEMCELSEILDNKELQVAIFKGNANLRVEDDIVYYSKENAKLAGERIVSIRPENEDAASERDDFAVEAMTDAEDDFITVNYGTESDAVETQETADESVDDDDLVIGTEEAEITFHFDRERSDGTVSTGASEVSEIYTYVIYQ